ncbi:hypothetical protein GCM10027610_144100 [Dactylosporangium cerinum]
MTTTVLAVIASAAVRTASKTSPIGRPGQDPSTGPTPGYPLIEPLSCVPQPVNPLDLTAYTHSDQPKPVPSSPAPRPARVTKYTSASYLDLHHSPNRIDATTPDDAATRSGGAMVDPPPAESAPCSDAIHRTVQGARSMCARPT